LGIFAGSISGKQGQEGDGNDPNNAAGGRKSEDWSSFLPEEMR
jgi:hypothetical protein